MAPHTWEMCFEDEWDRPYTRTQAAFPAPWVKANKFWPTVGRVDNVHGDRNLVRTKCREKTQTDRQTDRYRWIDGCIYTYV